MKPLGKIKIKWSPNFAYAIGLLATDGNLSPDGRHLNLTSQDKEQLINFMRCLGIRVKIGYKPSGFTGKPSTHIQFGDVNFYKFLVSIGLTPRKSRTIGRLDIPDRYFFNFLRGSFDGDGTFYSYWDPRWKSSFMFYTVFISASGAHIQWVRDQNMRLLGVKGYVTKVTHGEFGTWYQLKYAKGESLRLLRKIYYTDRVVCLKRKRLKVAKALSIIGERL